MKNVPNKIYLQVGELTDEEMREVDFDDLSEVTWCKDNIFPTDIEFCRSGQETLYIGKYRLPDGCKAIVSGGEIEISIKKDNRIKEGDWRNWFERYDLTEPLAVIHFTKFRYRYEKPIK